MSNSIEHSDQFLKIHKAVRQLLLQARHQALQTVNAAMVTAYWNIGRVIVEHEQAGKKRAGYGERVIEALAERLSEEFGRGFSVRNVWMMREFFLGYPILQALPAELSWTHFCLLLTVKKPDARRFYETEAVTSRWSTRELERQIASLLFERLALSRNKKAVKDVLEFAGLRQSDHLYESNLETALISKLQTFLLELGRGFSFVGRQQRISIDGQHFYVDLVFYNRLTRSFVLMDGALHSS